MKAEIGIGVRGLKLAAVLAASAVLAAPRAAHPRNQPYRRIELGADRLPFVGVILVEGEENDTVDPASSGYVFQENPLDGGIEGPGGGESPHVQFVNDVTLQGKAAPVVVRPVESRAGDLRWPVNALGLKTGGRVRSLQRPVQTKQIEGARLDAVQYAAVVSQPIPPQRLHPFLRGPNVHFHGIDERGPDAEPATPTAKQHRPQIELQWFHGESLLTLRKTAPRGGSTKFKE